MNFTDKNRLTENRNTNVLNFMMMASHENIHQQQIMQLTVQPMVATGRHFTIFWKLFQIYSPNWIAARRLGTLVKHMGRTRVEKSSLVQNFGEKIYFFL